MASYSYTPERCFVPCLGAAVLGLLRFSGQRALFKRLNKDLGLEIRKTGKEAKPHLSFRTVVGIVFA